MSLTWIEVSKSALLNNVGVFRKLSGKTKIMAVVKSNAYGHGLDLVALAVNDHVDWLGTVNDQEAILLRDKGVTKPILVLSYFDEDAIEQLLRKNISLVVYNSNQLLLIDAAAKKLKVKGKIHVKVDTGTSRLGFNSNEAIELLRTAKNFSNILVEGLFSHLASSEDNPKYTQKQLIVFNKTIQTISNTGIDIPIKHIACTAAALAYENSRFDLVRVGIGLYGLSSATRPKQLAELTPALTWKTKVLQAKQFPKNTFIGYGCSYKTKAAETLAVLPVGYFEGIDRKLSNKGSVLINGIKCPIRGRVCMNLIMVGVSKAGGVKAGDEAVIIGRQGSEIITTDDLAAEIGTINYEVVARINPLLPRILVA